MDKEMDKKINISPALIAIIRGVYGSDCLRLAEALHSGGIELLEVTFDQSSAELREQTLETIRLLNEHLGAKALARDGEQPNTAPMIFGAGTVTSVEMVRAAHEAGAKFIVSPNTDDVVIRETKALGMISIPGALTPTEIFNAARAGADFVKVFPAGAVGPAYFKSVLAPLNHVRLLAVGGINAQNLRSFLDAGAVGAGVSSCLYKKEWIRDGAWDKVTQAARDLVDHAGG